jgi:hypothetical protein
MTKPAKDIIMMGGRDRDIICGQASNESTKPTSSNEDTDDEGPNVLEVNTFDVERTESTDHNTITFVWGSLCLLVNASLHKVFMALAKRLKEELQMISEVSEERFTLK